MIFLALLACHEYDLDGIDSPETFEPQVPTPPEYVQDRFDGPAAPQLDVLFVIDDSCSMGPHQQRLADNLFAFADELLSTQVDFHVGVVTTDVRVHQGLLRRTIHGSWIDTDTPDPDAAFRALAQVGTGGSPAERGRAAAHAVLTHGRNPGFERERADLHLVFVSDEDDASGAIAPSEDFVRLLQDRKSTPEQVQAHAIIWPPATTCRDGVSEGFGYEHLAARTGGAVGNLCDDDWSPFLAELGFNAVPQRLELPLSERPQLEPWSLELVRVEADGSEHPLQTCLLGETCDAVYWPEPNTLVLTGTFPTDGHLRADYLPIP